MHKQLTCPQGHCWEVPLDDGFPCALAGIACPECGGLAMTHALADPASSSVPAAPPAEAAAALTSPVTIAGYEILGELGRGGMGVVYKARQVGLKRWVALKMIQPQAPVSLEQLERFRAEAEAVARLQHPQIVQIYELGEHGSRPYFSLELMDGGSLDKKLAGAPQPARAAAAMLETLARAVHYAHQHGIVHRDLKPANVLLTADGTPKITDFGLAKLLDAEVEQTRSGAILGTPCYMAPEQAQGQKEAIGPASDVYGLGALLYELLTGRPPFRGPTVQETLAQVQTQELVSPRRLQPQLPRDLETICLKCLEKDPRKRYASALDLADDLHRFLAGEPIVARPITTWERAWKWARRRPAAAALAVVSGLAGLSLLAISLAFNGYLQRLNQQLRETVERADQKAREADEQRAEAERQQQAARTNEERALRQEADADRQRRQAVEAKTLAELRTQNILELVIWMLMPGDDYLRSKGVSPAVRGALLEHARAFLAAHRKDFGENYEFLTLLAVAHSRVGQVQLERKNFPAALANLRESTAILKSVKAPPHYRFVPINLSVAEERIGDVFAAQGEFGAALFNYENSLKTRQALQREFPDDLWPNEYLARIHAKIGEVYAKQGQLDKALAHGQDDLGLRKVLADANPADTPAQRQLALSYERVAQMQKQLGRDPDASDSLEAARQIRAELSSAKPVASNGRLEEARRYVQAGDQHLRQGTCQEALDNFQRALPVFQARAVTNPNNASAQKELALAHERIGKAEEQFRRLPEALASFDESHKIFKRLAEANPRDVRAKRDLARASNILGYIHMYLGQEEERSQSDRKDQWQQARQWFQQSFEIQDALAKQGVYKTADGLQGLKKLIVDCEKELDKLAKQEPASDKLPAKEQPPGLRPD